MFFYVSAFIVAANKLYQRGNTRACVKVCISMVVLSYLRPSPPPLAMEVKLWTPLQTKISILVDEHVPYVHFYELWNVVKNVNVNVDVVITLAVNRLA
jgi:hypothetical protein